jgi:ABC-type proline/glycine betaine transport system permease subunit
MDSFWLDYAGEIAFRTGEHLFLTGIAMAIGSLIGIPLGILIRVCGKKFVGGVRSLRVSESPSRGGKSE